MKIDKYDYSVILEEFKKLKDIIPRHADRLLKSKNPPKNLNLRVRWDCFYSCFVDGHFINKLYKIGLNDDNIDTALRKAMKEIGLPQFAK